MSTTITTPAAPSPSRAQIAPPDLVIPVAGHVLDYRDTAEIAGIVRLMRDMGFVPWVEYRATPSATRSSPARPPQRTCRA